MAIYKVTLRYEATATYEIDAETEEEAQDHAEELLTFDAYGNISYIDIDDIEEME